MGKVLAVDWGMKRAGVAVSDETKTLARTLPLLHKRKGEPLDGEIARIARTEGADTVLVGYPLHMDGRQSSSAHQVQRLADRLREELPGVRVVLWDERLSSRQAGAILKEKGERMGPGTKGRLDQVAAALLLQEYLDGGER